VKLLQEMDLHDDVCAALLAELGQSCKMDRYTKYGFNKRKLLHGTYVHCVS
jgi:hypothetical protein